MIPVCIDIETRPAFVPPEDMQELAEESKANPKRTPATRADWAADPVNQATAWARGALGIVSARVVAVAVVIDDRPVQSWADWGDESHVLRNLERALAAVEAPLWIGHNVAGFDLPILRVGAMRHGLTQLRDMIPTYRYSDRIHDNMVEAVKPAGHTSGVSADALARSLGLAGKGEIGRLDFADLYARALAGAEVEVAELLRLRCETDAAVEWATFQKMTRQG
jgi:hypothetical protein